MSERDAFWKFAVTYNLSLLSVLYLVLITITTYMLTFRITLGGWYMGPMGFWIGFIYLLVLAIAFCSWIFCIWKSWRLTDFDHSYRVATMAYLFGAPALLFILSSDIMSGILYGLGVWVPMR